MCLITRFTTKQAGSTTFDMNELLNEPDSIVLLILQSYCLQFSVVFQVGKIGKLVNKYNLFLIFLTN